MRWRRKEACGEQYLDAEYVTWFRYGIHKTICTPPKENLGKDEI
jgi:hypothetical protein